MKYIYYMPDIFSKQMIFSSVYCWTKNLYVWITDASPFKISGEQPSRSNREGAAKDSNETIGLKKLLSELEILANLKCKIVKGQGYN